MATSHVASFAIVLFRCRGGVGGVTAAPGSAALPEGAAALFAGAVALAASTLVAAVVLIAVMADTVSVRGDAAPVPVLLLFAVCGGASLCGVFAAGAMV